MTVKSQLNILAPVGYPWDFSGPRHSRHHVTRRKFLPFNRLRGGLDGFTAFNPVDTAKADLIHAFNRIPLNFSRFVIGFESHLPRLFGIDAAAYEKFLHRQLLSKRCLKIVAISQYAEGNFLENMASSPLSDKDQEILKAKLDLRYPNMVIPPKPADEPVLEGEIHLTFVGNHFARKGGCTTLRMAELALERGLPYIFNIVSSLQSGGGIWTDPSNEEFFKPYLKLLSLPNVRYHRSLPNKDVVDLLERSHFSILTTFADTFGYSAIESMAKGTPVICTAQGALPEFIKDGKNGFVLPPALTAGAPDWRPDFSKRGTPEFETLFASNVERLALGAMEKLQSIHDPLQYANMRHAAYSTAIDFFDSKTASSYWDAIYEEVA